MSDTPRADELAREHLRIGADCNSPGVVQDWIALAQKLERELERYSWLRKQTWDKSALCVVTEPKETVRLGTYCPSGDQLDAAIDAAIAANKTP